ncbi:MAG: aldolase/citrate lyase family protein [Pirellulales bacterium]
MNIQPINFDYTERYSTLGSSTFIQRRREKAGPLLTLTLNTFDPIFVEVAAQIGVDIIWIEMEHASISLREAENLTRMIQGNGLLSLIRLPNCDREIVLKTAEIGADMLMAPMITHRSDLENLVKFSRYAPQGERGFYVSSRALNYGLGSTLAELRAVANDRLMLWAQVETLPALELLDEFCQVPGIDGIFIGSGDLSSAYGVPGETTDPRVVRAVSRGVEASRRYQKCCASVMPAAEISNWRDCELDMVAIGGNVGFYVAAAKALQEKLHMHPQPKVTVKSSRGNGCATADVGKPAESMEKHPIVPKPHKLQVDGEFVALPSAIRVDHENQQS